MLAIYLAMGCWHSHGNAFLSCFLPTCLYPTTIYSFPHRLSHSSALPFGVLDATALMADPKTSRKARHHGNGAKNSMSPEWDLYNAAATLENRGAEPRGALSEAETVCQHLPGTVQDLPLNHQHPEQCGKPVGLQTRMVATWPRFPTWTKRGQRLFILSSTVLLAADIFRNRPKRIAVFPDVLGRVSSVVRGSKFVRGLGVDMVLGWNVTRQDYSQLAVEVLASSAAGRTSRESPLPESGARSTPRTSGAG